VAESTVHNSLREIEVTLLSLEAGVQRRLTGEERRHQIMEYLLEVMNRLTQSEFGIRGIINFYAHIDSQILVRNIWAPQVAPERPWNLAVERMGEIVFSNPSLDKRTGIAFVSALKAFNRKNDAGNEEIGIVGIDLDVSSLFKYVVTFMSEDGGYGMLLDRDFKFVAHPDPEYLHQSLDKISEEHENVYRKLETGQDYIPSSKLRNARGQVVMSSFRRLENGWFLGLATPIDIYYEDLREMSAILAALGLIFMLVLSCFLLKLNAAKMRSDEENRSKSSFLARMSHEIRTPMNSILGMSELIMRHNISKDIRECVAAINQAGQNLLALINDILDFSKIESGQLTVETGEYSFRSLLNDLVGVARLWFANKPVVFLLNVDGNIPETLVGDDIRIRQVVTNLLSNGVKYTREGFVSLDVRMEPIDARRARLIFKIEDSGIGIKQEDMGRLFVDFSRLTAEYTRKVEGTGLGLVIARMLCQLMEGDIAVSSESGRGSVFTATVIQGLVHGHGEDEEKIAVVKDAAQKRLLLYEENPFRARSALRTMRELGTNAEQAFSLREFIEKFNGGGYDCAFVPSKYADCCFSAPGAPQARLAAMMEVDEMFVSSQAESVPTPLYCVLVADLLNGVVRDGYENVGKFAARFKAPSARVLIVDDMRTNLKVAEGLMSIYGMEIHLAGSAFDAIELLKENAYDIVFMDHMMPKMDGVQATGIIREMGKTDARYRKLPVIALTANALSGQQEVFLRAGMNDFLAKPIEVKKLDIILRKWIPAKKQVEVPGAEHRRHPSEKEPEPGVFVSASAIAIPGVDCAMGIRNSGDSVDVYKDILASFCEEAAETAVKVERSLLSDDAKNYAILVHALKGASRSIGAMEFAELAFRLETLAKERDMAGIRDGTDELLEKLRVLTGDIRCALGGAPEEEI
jgi:signal transduction histidine kinase/CheY-like chemotaxis protein